ncbi:MAG TPA: hypothetical protein VF235_07880 [Actinomycetota bacterium]
MSLRHGRALIVAALVASALVAAVPGAAAAARDPRRGTWVLQEASSVKALNRSASAIRSALRHEGVIGLSIRVPWSSLEHRQGVYDLRIVRRAKELVGGKQLSIGFMAGRFTPSFRRGHSMVYDGSATGGRGAGAVIPLPFARDGGPNHAFERGWNRLSSRLATWARHHGVRLLHLSWPGLLWAELALVDQMMRQPGYSYAAARNTHRRILSAGLRLSTRRMHVAFATTGHAPNELRMDLQRTLLASPRVRRCYFQANNVEPSGWGLPSDPPPPKRGAQMVQASNTYDWGAVYRAVRNMYATYLEVYTPSFSGGTSSQLLAQAADFA